VFRISPDEPWRVIRTQWRVNGLVPGPIEGGGRPSGYFTGATGITIYRGDALGPEFIGNAFVGDAGGNLVHRKLILPDGIGVKGVRPNDEAKVEFLASTDNWFRPVQMANAPDGCLYICDMYREVIEHPWSLPDSIKKHLDLNSGNDRGRIYRVAPEEFEQRPQPRLSRASTTELVKLLDHPNGWHRDTAARLIYERQDRVAIPPLSEFATSTGTPNATIHTLHALAGLHALKEDELINVISRGHAAVLEHALKLADPFPDAPSDKLWKAIRQAIERSESDSDAGDLQMAVTLGALEHSGRLETLWRFLERRTPPYRTPTAQLRQNDAVTWLQAAVLSALKEDSSRFFDLVSNSPAPGQDPSRAALLGRIAMLIGEQNNPDEIVAVVKFAADAAFHRISADVFEEDPLLASKVIIGLDEGLRRKGKSLPTAAAVPVLKQFYQSIRPIATGRRWTHPEPILLEAVKAYGTATYDEIRTDLKDVLTNAANSASMKKAAVAAMAKSADSKVGSDLLATWAFLTPGVRAEVVAALIQRPERIRYLLAALEKGLVNTGDLSVAQQAQLRSHHDAAIRGQAAKVLGRAPTASRQSVVDAFQAAPTLTGAPANGRKIYQARCATCHKLGAEGHALGPDLATVKNAGREKLLSNILDPNREVNPIYRGYTVETRDGESLTGLIVDESAATVTLRMAGGSETVIPRAGIASMESQGRSLMPEGLEEGLSAQDMADLLEFILAP
jgi:putative heme-binding domain-containing protein